MKLYEVLVIDYKDRIDHIKQLIDRKTDLEDRLSDLSDFMNLPLNEIEDTIEYDRYYSEYWDNYAELEAVTSDLSESKWYLHRELEEHYANCSPKARAQGLNGFYKVAGI